MAEMLMEDAPRKARELFEKGLRAMERNNLDYAMDLFVSSLELEPRLLRVRKFLRAAQVKKFKDGKGGAMTHAISSLTGFAGVMATRAAIKKDPRAAVIKAEKLLRTDPLNMTFIKVFGEAALAADLPEAALQTLEMAREHYPKNIPFLNWLGNIYLQQKQPSKARDCFEHVVRMRPNDQQAVKSLKDAAALATMQTGGWEGADSYRDVMKDSKKATLLEQEDKAVKTSKNIDVLISDTLTKIQKEPVAGRFEEAIAAMQEAQKVSSGDPQIDMALSTIRLKQFDAKIAELKDSGDTAGAKQQEQARDVFHLEEAQNRVSRYPNDLQFRFELGALLYENGKYNEAIQQLQLAQRNPQRRTRALYYLARCFSEKGQLDIAMEQLETAASEIVTMDKTKKDILYELGEIAEKMENPEKATSFYKQIYAVDISYRDIAAKMEQAYKK